MVSIPPRELQALREEAKMARAAESKLAKEVQRLDTQLVAAEQLLASRGPTRPRGGGEHHKPFKQMDLADYSQRLQELSPCIQSAILSSIFAPLCRLFLRAPPGHPMIFWSCCVV